METFKILNSKKEFVCLVATERDNDNAKEDILMSYERATKLLEKNPELNLLDEFDACLEDVDVVRLHPIEIIIPEKKMKVLLIKNEDSFDLIVEDGGYAFIWNIDNKIKVDLHQGRIESHLGDDDEIAEVLTTDKNYFQEFEGNELTDEMLDDILNWLVTGATLNDFEITRVESTPENHKIINQFLDTRKKNLDFIWENENFEDDDPKYYQRNVAYLNSLSDEELQERVNKLK
jgi:hypothetical protein